MSFSGKRSAASSRHRRLARNFALEDRRLLAVTTELDGSTFFIRGEDDIPETVELRIDNNGELEVIEIATPSPGVIGNSILAGDYNTDGSVDKADYTLWRNTLGSTTNLRADGDQNEIVDQADYDIWLANVGATSLAGISQVAIPGDYNTDGSVDKADYTLWRNTLGSTTNLRADGDQNEIVDQADYDIWLANSGTNPAVAAGLAPSLAGVTSIVIDMGGGGGDRVIFGGANAFDLVTLTGSESVSLLVTNAEQVDLGQDITAVDLGTTSPAQGDISIEGPTRLTRSSTLVANSVTFTASVDASDNGAGAANSTSDYGLTVQLTGALRFEGEVGRAGVPLLEGVADPDGLRFLDTLDLNVGATADAVELVGGSVTTTRDQSYVAPVALLSDTQLTSLDGSLLFAEAVAGNNNDLEINFFASVDFAASIAGIDELTIADDDARALGQIKLPAAPGALVETEGNQTFDAPVLLREDTTVRSNSGSVTFGDFIDAMDNAVAGTSDHGLAVEFSTTGAFGAEVGGHNQPVALMASDPDGLAYLTVEDLLPDNEAPNPGQVKFNVTDPGLDADPAVAVMTVGDQTYNAPVLLLQDTLLTSTAGSVLFNDYVDAMDNAVAGTSDHGLTVNFADTLEVDSEIGGDNQDALDMDSDVDGLQYFTANDFGAGQVKLDVADPAVAVMTVGDQTYNAPVLLLQDTILTSTAGSVLFNDYVDAMDNAVAGTSDHGLTVNFADTLEVDSEIGGDNQDALDMDSDVDGLQYFTANDFGAGQVKLDVADPAVAVMTVGDQTYNAPVLLLQDTLLTSTAGSVLFNDYVDAMDNAVAGTSDHGLTVNFADTLEVDSEIGGDNQDALDMDSDVDGLQYFTANDFGAGQVKLDVADPAVAVMTVGDQTYNAPVLLLQDTILTSTAGSVLFNDYVDAMDNAVAGTSDHGLTVNFADTLEVDSEIGGDNQDALDMDSDVDGLQYFTANDFGAGQVKLDVADPAVAVMTVGDQTYNAPVLLLQDTLLTSTAGSVLFNDYVDAMDNAVAGTSDHGLTVNFADTLEVDSEIGGDNQDALDMDSDVDGLQYFTANDFGAGQVKLDVADPAVAVMTVGDQTYNAPVLLLQDTILTSTAGSVLFNDYVDAMDNAVAGTSDHGLTVNFADTLEVDSEIGGDNQDALDMDSDVDGLQYFTANDFGAGQVKLDVADPAVAVMTVGDQTYNAPVLLLQDTLLTSTAGSVLFNDYVDAMDNAVAGTSDHGLTVNFADTLEVDSEIGGDNQDALDMDSDVDGLQYFTANDFGAGQVKLDVADPAVAVMTVGDQTYNAPVLLLQDTILTSTAGSVLFNDYVDAMDNAVAGTSDHGLTVNFADTLEVDSEIGGDNQDALDMDSDVDGLQYFTANDFGAGQVKLDVADPAVAVMTVGDQTYNAPVLLLQDTILTSTAGSVLFNDYVDAMDNAVAGTSDHGLTVNFADTLEVDSEIGGDNQDALDMDSDVDGLQYFTANDFGAGQVKLDVADPAVAVMTVGDQTYNAPVLLLQDTILTSTAGSVLFNDYVDAMDNAVAGTSDHGLTVNFADTLEVDSEIGGDNQDALDMDSDVDGLQYFTANDFGAGQVKLDVADPAVAVMTVGDQTYNAPVLLLQDTILTSTAGSVLFNDYVDAMDNAVAGTSDHGLTVNFADTLEVDSEIGGDNQDALDMDSDVDGLQYFTANDFGAGQVKLDVADPAVAVMTVGDQTYNAPVLLLQDTILTSTAGSVLFNDYVDAMDNAVAGTSDHGLTVNFADTLEVDSEIGGDNQDALDMDSDVDGLQYFTANDFGAGQVKLDVADPAVAVMTVGDQTYNAPVLLLQDTILTSTAGSVLFNDYVDAMDNAVAGTSDHGLTVNFADTLEVDSEIGGDNQDALDMDSDVDGLQYFTANDFGAGQVKLDVADPAVAVMTVGDQTYNAPVLLLQDTILTSTAGSVLFNDYVDAMDNAVAGTSDHGLTVNFADTLEVDSEIGGDNQDALDMDSDVDGLQYFTANDFGAGQVKLDVADPAVAVMTVGDQTYNAPVLLLQDTILTSTAGSVLFNDYVDAMDNAVAAASSYGLTVNAPTARSLGDPRGGEVFAAAVGADGQDGLAMASDANGLAFVRVNMGPPAVAGGNSLLVNVPITTTGEIELRVEGTAGTGGNENNLTIGELARLNTDGDGAGDALGVVTLSAGDNVDIEPDATITAEELLDVLADTDGDGAGATVSTVTDTPDTTDAAGLLTAPLITITTADEPDTIDLQAERFSVGSDVTIASLGGDDQHQLVFSDGGVLSAASLTVEAGLGNSDRLTNNYVKDSSARTVRATYTASFADVMGQASPVIDGSASAFDGLNTGSFSTNSVEQYLIRAGASGEPDLFGVQTATGLVTDSNLAEPNFLRLEQQVALFDSTATAMDLAGFGQYFQVESVEGLELEGSEVRDNLQNNSSVPALIDGGDGNDNLIGRQVEAADLDPDLDARPIDVIIAGAGVTDTPGGPVFFDPSGVGTTHEGDVLAGGDGQDFIFSDVVIFVDPSVPFGRDALYGVVVFDEGAEGDIVSGDLVGVAVGEINHGVQVGANDMVSGLTGMFLDGGAEKDFFMWLFANPMPVTQDNIDKLVQDSFFGSANPEDGKVGLLEQVIGDQNLTDDQLLDLLAEYGIEERERTMAAAALSLPSAASVAYSATALTPNVESPATDDAPTSTDSSARDEALLLLGAESNSNAFPYSVEEIEEAEEEESPDYADAIDSPRTSVTSNNAGQ